MANLFLPTVLTLSLACLSSAGVHAFSRKSPEPAHTGTGTPGTPGTSVSTAEAAGHSVWITRPDGAQSCTTGTGQSLDDGAAELRKSRVRVIESRKGNDGKMHAQMCGIPSGSTNSFLIPSDDLPRAIAQGYVETR